MVQATQHVPVLLREVLDGLQPQSGGRFIDCTLGGGGHSRALLDRIGWPGRLLALDADPSAIERARRNLGFYGDRVVFVHANFARLGEVAREQGFQQVDGVLMDLGMSVDQLTSDRGFGFHDESALDMRFDVSRGEAASALVNALDVDELADVIFRYGEEPASRKIARAIVAARPIRSAARLAQVVA